MTGIEPLATAAAKEVAVESAKTAVTEVSKGGAESAAREVKSESVRGAGIELGGGPEDTRCALNVLRPDAIEDAAIDENPFTAGHLDTTQMKPFPPFDELVETEKSSYEHMKGSLKSLFKSLGIEIKVEPKGMPHEGKADIIGIDSSGNLVVGEIKTAQEAGKSSSAWWSYWKDKLYSDALSNLSTEAKEWTAVIDGQLRTYCDRLGVDNGLLVVENGDQFESGIEETLGFLREEGRIKGYEKMGTDATGNTAYRIFYN